MAKQTENWQIQTNNLIIIFMLINGFLVNMKHSTTLVLYYIDPM